MAFKYLRITPKLRAHCQHFMNFWPMYCKCTALGETAILQIQKATLKDSNITSLLRHSCYFKCKRLPLKNNTKHQTWHRLQIWATKAALRKRRKDWHSWKESKEDKPSPIILDSACWHDRLRLTIFGCSGLFPMFSICFQPIGSDVSDPGASLPEGDGNLRMVTCPELCKSASARFKSNFVGRLWSLQN